MGAPFLPFAALRIAGVTRMSLGTPERFFERVSAAQSNGEWPGSSRTFLRAFDPAGPDCACALEGRRVLDETFGGDRFGSGPVVGTRKPPLTDGFGVVGAGLGLVLICVGRDGGGINFDASVCSLLVCAALEAFCSDLSPFVDTSGLFVVAIGFES